MITPKSKLVVAILFLLVFFTSLTNVQDSSAFLPLMGGTNIIQDSVQGFCNITNQTQTMHCSSTSTTLHITHGKAMTVNLFPSNYTIFVNATGAIGPQGPQGPTGATGPQGAAGSQIYTGAGSPSGGLGVNGDFYINVTTGDYYQKSGGSWVLKGNLTGPTGPTGPQGPRGFSGTNGTNGSNGRNGTNGTNGTNGSNGTNGRNGTNGTSAFFNSINCSANQFIYAYNNATHLASCAIPLNTAQVVNADNGTSLISAKFNSTETKLKTLNNVTNYVNWIHNSTRITPSYQFKVNTLSCPANSAFISYNNSTGLLTCQAFGNVTNINDLGDVVISSASNGQILQYTSPTWKNVTFKANTLSCPANQAFISFNNATGTLTCQAFGSGTITGSANAGKATGSVGVLATGTSNLVRGRNATGVSPISLTKTNDTDFSISCPTCLTPTTGVSQITVIGSGSANATTGKVQITTKTYQNNTGSNLSPGLGLYTSNSGSVLQFRGIVCGVGMSCSNNGTSTRINSTATGTVTAVNGSPNNTTSTGGTTPTINLGSNALVSNGADQPVTKSTFTVNNLKLGGDENANSHLIHSLGTPTSSTDAQVSNHLGLLGSLVVGPCTSQSHLIYNIGNTTWICDPTAYIVSAIQTIDGDSSISHEFIMNSPLSINDAGLGFHYFSCNYCQTNVVNETYANNKGIANNTNEYNFINGTAFTFHLVKSKNHEGTVNQAVNITGSCTTCLTSAITSVNSQTGPSISINRGSVTNMSSITNSSNTISYQLKNDIVLTNGSAQRINKVLTIQNPQINGISHAFVAKTSNYVATTFDTVITVDATNANPTTITLPSASVNVNETYTIKRIDYTKNLAQVLTTSNQKIDGFNNYNLTNAMQSVTVISDGSNWKVLEQQPAVQNDHFIRNGIVNRWYGSEATVFTPTTVTPTTSTLAATPFVVSHSSSFDKIQLEVTTLVAGSTCRMGIYNDNGTGYPAFLVSGSDVGTVSGAGTGVQTNTFGSVLKLQEGLYWIANQCSTATTIQLRGIPNTAMSDIMGVISTMGTTATGTGYTATNTFGALPNAFPTAGAAVATGNQVEVLLHRVG